MTHRSVSDSSSSSSSFMVTYKRLKISVDFWVLLAAEEAAFSVLDTTMTV